MSEVEKYIQSFTEETQVRLTEMRKIVLRCAPEAIERMAYGMPGYKLNNKPLVYFGGFKNHVGFYATPTGHKKFEKEFAKYRQGKGSVQFPLNEPLPVELIEKVVKFRVKENNEK